MRRISLALLVLAQGGCNLLLPVGTAPPRADAPAPRVDGTSPRADARSPRPDVAAHREARERDAFSVDVRFESSTCVGAVSETSCGDGRDDDCDGLIDCADPECAGIGPCPPATFESDCQDKQDNDNDKLIDCADPDCNTMACDDGNPCTMTDICLGQACLGKPYACTAGQCQASAICDGNGGCSFKDKPTSTPCDDNNVSTCWDTCDGLGNCKSGPLCQ